MDTIIQIRESVFETNSSSTHSLVIKKREDASESNLFENGVLYADRLHSYWLNPGTEYGTSYLNCHNFYQKLSLVINLLDNYREDIDEDIIDDLVKYIEERYVLSVVNKLSFGYIEYGDPFENCEVKEDFQNILDDLLEKCEDNEYEFVLQHDNY